MKMKDLPGAAKAKAKGLPKGLKAKDMPWPVKAALIVFVLIAAIMVFSTVVNINNCAAFICFNF